MVLIQDSKGKLTGSGTFYFYLGDPYPDFTVYFEVKGKVKGSKGIITIKFKLKGEGGFDIDGKYYEFKVSEIAKVVIDQPQQIMYGTVTAKLCIKGGGCDSGEEDLYMDLEDDMTGKAVLLIEVESDESGKKLEGSGALILSNNDTYNLYAKGKHNSKKGETKYQLKGDNETTKGIKFKLKMDAADNATQINGKAFGQTLKYKLQ